VFKGFEGFLSSKDNQRKRARALKADERLFSLASLTSDAHNELALAGEAERAGGAVAPGKKGKR